MQTIKKIFGISYEEIFDGEVLIWRAFIHQPFWKDGKLEVGLNEKFLKLARVCGVNKILLVVGVRKFLQETRKETIEEAEKLFRKSRDCISYEIFIDEWKDFKDKFFKELEKE